MNTSFSSGGLCRSCQLIHQGCILQHETFALIPRSITTLPGCPLYLATIPLVQKHESSDQLFARGNALLHSEESAQGIVLLEKAAVQGHCEAQFVLGEYYLTKKGSAAEAALGFSWMRKAALQGNAAAECIMGECCLWGNGTKMNPSAAFYWFLRAAERSYPAGEYYVGIFYSNGIIEKKNMECAVQWLKKSAAHGNLDAKKELSKFKYLFWR